MMFEKNICSVIDSNSFCSMKHIIWYFILCVFMHIWWSLQQNGIKISQNFNLLYKFHGGIKAKKRKNREERKFYLPHYFFLKCMKYNENIFQIWKKGHFSAPKADSNLHMGLRKHSGKWFSLSFSTLFCPVI